MTNSVELIVNEFTKFPGIGRKTAERLAYFMIFKPIPFTEEFTQIITQARNNILFCDICNNIGDTNPCAICEDMGRDRSKICVVETPKDLIAIDQSGSYKGLYHVLGGALSPIDGITPDKLYIDSLTNRLEPSIEEIIIATNSNVAGEMTALYLKKMLNEYGIQLTRIAKGLPFGSDLEYSDKITISNAFQGRQIFKNEFTQ